MFVMTRIVTALGGFDLDDRGAEISQRLRASGAGDDPGEIDDQKTVKRGRRPLFSRQPARQFRSRSHDQPVPSLDDLWRARIVSGDCTRAFAVLPKEVSAANAFSDGCYEKDAPDAMALRK